MTKVVIKQSGQGAFRAVAIHRDGTQLTLGTHFGTFEGACRHFSKLYRIEGLEEYLETKKTRK